MAKMAKGSCIEDESGAERLDKAIGGKIGKDKFDNTGKSGSSMKPTAGPSNRMGVMKLNSKGGGRALGG